MSHRISTRRSPRQLKLRRTAGWGGARKNAGRKPGKGRRNVAHRSRQVFHRRTPVHVTLRMAPHVYNLRSQRSRLVIEAALRGGSDRFEVRVVELSVQGDHVHLIVEAPDQVSLSRAVRGLSIRLARGLNKMMGGHGRVLGDRYHAHLLRSPTEVRNALHYVRHNRRHHLAAVGREIEPSWRDPFTGEGLAMRLPAAETWLLREGWRRSRRGAHPR